MKVLLTLNIVFCALGLSISAIADQPDSITQSSVDSFEHISFVGLKDQFDNPVSFSDATKWVVFVAEKPMSQLFNEKVQALKIQLDEKPVVYVSDISKMPALITKMFALPKMKKIGYKMALDRDGEITKNWPREEGNVTLMQITGQKVTEVVYLQDEEQVEAFLLQL